MKRFAVFMMALLLALSGCAGLDFSHLDPDAPNFHPKRIAVLPETVGPHESARDVVNIAVSKALSQTGWYEGVVNGEMIKTQTIGSPELSKEILAYIEQVNTRGVSDPDRAAKLGDILKADALLLTDVTSWGFGKENGNKVCRVGLEVKLIDASKGTVIWKANHELVEDYLIFKPKINDVADALLSKMIKEMPH